MRRVLALLLALLALPLAQAQFVSHSPAVMVDGPEARDLGGSIVEIRIETGEDPKMRSPSVSPWLVVGYDNILNLTVMNMRDQAVNATFRINASGATVTPDEIVLRIPAHGTAGQAFVVQPSDVGLVKIRAGAIDAFQPSGEPLEANFDAPALLLPSMRFLDPAVPATDPEDEFVAVQSWYGARHPAYAYARIPPGGSIVPRVELKNPFETTLAAFTLRLRVGGSTAQTVDVPALEPGATHVVEFDEYRPVERGFGPSFGGPMGSYELRPIAEVRVGGALLTAAGLTFRVERGAVTDVMPVAATIEVQDGLAIDLFVPRTPVLGQPTRVRYNLTNLQTTPVQGPLMITLMTPHRLVYEVQGPETFEVRVDLAPGERRTGTVEFTPRVTGSWLASTFFRSPQGYGFGHGGAFDVAGPIVVGFDRTDQLFTRIGQSVEVDLFVATTQTLQDAELRVGVSAQVYREPSRTSGADYRAGLSNRLVESETASRSLGTLRPGGVVNMSVDVKARAAGGYNIVPYVLAEGFAYTTTVQLDENGRPLDLGVPLSGTMLNLMVQPRAVPAGLSLAPFTLGLAFFVGAWTLRTRFVK